MGLQRYLDRLDKQALAWGAVLFLLAFLVRLPGIGWSLPSPDRHATYHPDEPLNVAVSREVNWAKGDFLPGFYNYGTLYLSMTALATTVGAGYSGATSETPEGQIKLQAARIMGARILSSLSGAGIAVLCFLILWRRTHVLGAALAGAAAALAPGLVVHSRFATVDVPAVFLGLLSIYWAFRILPLPDEEPMEEGRMWRMILYCGIFAGLSAACKYSGGLAVLALLPVALSRQGIRGLGLVAGGIAFSLVAFFLAVPGFFLESPEFLAGFLYEVQHVGEGHGTVFMETPNGFIFHLGNLFEAFSFILVFVGMAGLIRASWKGHPWAWGLLIFTLVTYFLIGRAEVKFLRYVFPIIPCLAVGAGWLAGQAHGHPRQSMKAVTALVLLGIGGVMGGGMIRTVQNTIFMTSPDPREEAAAWIKSKAQPGESVGLVSDPWFQTPTLYPQINDHPMMGGIDRMMQLIAAAPIPVDLYVPENPNERFAWDQRLLAELRPAYITASSFEVDDYDRIAQSNPQSDQGKLFKDRFLTFSKRLKEDYEVAAVFGADGPRIHDMMYIRPRVWIWKRKAAAGSSPSSSTPSSSSGG